MPRLTAEFLPPAEEEMNEAAQFYESRSRGLGRAFLGDVENTVASILRHPGSGHKLTENIRRRFAIHCPFPTTNLSPIFQKPPTTTYPARPPLRPRYQNIADIGSSSATEPPLCQHD